MCLACIIIAIITTIFAVAAALGIIAGVIAFLIISIVLFISALSRYNNAKRLTPSIMRCPNCGSTNVRIRSVMSGQDSSYSGGGAGASSGGFHLFGGLFGGKSGTSYKFKREAVCQDCGFNFDYFTADDVNNERHSAAVGLIGKSILLFFAIIFAAALVAGSSDSSSDTEDKDATVAESREPSSKDTDDTSDKSSKKSAKEKSIWTTDVTPIDDFDYYVDGNDIYIKEYKGKDKKIRIASTYAIDGEEYNVVSFADGVFALKNIKSCILPEGLQTMENNTFNSCGVEFIYIPASLQPDPEESYGFYEYFFNVEKVYYGGTEKEWAELTNHADRSEIDVKQIVCNADISDLN